MSSITGCYLVDSFNLPLSSSEGSKKARLDEPFVHVAVETPFGRKFSVNIDLGVAADQLVREGIQSKADVISRISRGCLFETVLEAKAFDLTEGFSSYVKITLPDSLDEKRGLKKLIKNILVWIEHSQLFLTEGVHCFDQQTQSYVLVQGQSVHLMIQGYRVELNRVDVVVESALEGVNFHDKVDELSVAFNKTVSLDTLYQALAQAAFLVLTRKQNSYFLISGESSFKIIYDDRKNILFECGSQHVRLKDQFIGRKQLERLNFITQIELILGTINLVVPLKFEQLLDIFRLLDNQGDVLKQGYTISIERIKIQLFYFERHYYVGYGNFAVSIYDGYLRLDPRVFLSDALNSAAQKLVEAFPSEVGLLEKERFKRILSSPSLTHPDLSNQSPKIVALIEDSDLIFKVKGYRVKLSDCNLGLDHETLKKVGYTLDGIKDVESEFVKYCRGEISSERMGSCFQHVLHRRSIWVISPAHIILNTEKLLGKGAAKQVYQAVNLVSGKIFAYYRFELEGASSLEEGCIRGDRKAFEIRDLKSKIPGCVQAVHVIETPIVGVVSKVAFDVFMKQYNGDLFSLVMESGVRLSEQEKFSLVRQIGQHLHRLHSSNQAYCDLKMENILVKLTKKRELYGFKAVLGDLESIITLPTSSVEGNQKMKVPAITFNYITPELAAACLAARSLKDTSYRDYQGLDVWAFALLICEVYLKQPVIESVDQQHLRHAFNKRANVFNVPNSINYYDLEARYPAIYRIVSHMLVPQERRWTMDRVIAELSILQDDGTHSAVFLGTSAIGDVLGASLEIASAAAMPVPKPVLGESVAKKSPKLALSSAKSPDAEMGAAGAGPSVAKPPFQRKLSILENIEADVGQSPIPLLARRLIGANPIEKGLVGVDLFKAGLLKETDSPPVGGRNPKHPDFLYRLL